MIAAGKSRFTSSGTKGTCASRECPEFFRALIIFEQFWAAFKTRASNRVVVNTMLAYWIVIGRAEFVHEHHVLALFKSGVADLEHGCSWVETIIGRRTIAITPPNRLVPPMECSRPACRMSAAHGCVATLSSFHYLLFWNADSKRSWLR